MESIGKPGCKGFTEDLVLKARVALALEFNSVFPEVEVGKNRSSFQSNLWEAYLSYYPCEESRGPAMGAADTTLSYTTPTPARGSAQTHKASERSLSADGVLVSPQLQTGARTRVIAYCRRLLCACNCQRSLPLSTD